MNYTPKYFRARIAVIEQLIKSVGTDDKSNDRVVLRNGVFPKSFNEQKLVKEMFLNRDFSNDPLCFEELTRFNTWFALYPKKVAGTERITSSREFPITIKGTKEDILRVVRNGEPTWFELQLKVKRSKAKLKILNL